MDEVEQDRLLEVAGRDAQGAGWRARHAPGSFGCHEALHVSSMLADTVALRLVEHGAVIQRADWYALAARAHEALFDLYQAIGAEHLAIGDDAERRP